jgi:hypothetical protein
MDAAQEADSLSEGTPPLDSYALVLWPAASTPDRIVRQTSSVAAYWHSTRR